MARVVYAEAVSRNSATVTCESRYGHAADRNRGWQLATGRGWDVFNCNMYAGYIGTLGREHRCLYNGEGGVGVGRRWIYFF